MKKTIVTIVIVVLVAALIGVLVYAHDAKKVTAPTTMTQASQPKPEYASVGQLTAGFPAGLMLGKNATPVSSYAIPYTTSDQSTVVYVTTDAMTPVYNQYLSYFQQNKYEVLNKSESAKIDTIYAISSTAGGTSSDVNVTIVPDGTQSKVTTSYLKK